MTWFDWILIGFWCFGAFSTIGRIGKPRKPIDPTEAALATAILLGLTVGLLLTRGAFA